MGWSEGPFYRGAQQEQREAVRNRQRLQGTQQLGPEPAGDPTAGDVGASSGSRGRGWRGGGTEAQTERFQAQRKRNWGK